MVAKSRLHQGTYKPQNPKKYKGDATNIVYRSGWEFTFMRWCDTNPSILEWSSEEIIIPYRSLLDEHYEKMTGKVKWHRYYVDFYMKIKDKNGEVKRYLVEIKPSHETKPPIITEKTSKKSAIYMKKNWIVNTAKWKAAKEYAANRKMQFEIITEKELYGYK